MGYIKASKARIRLEKRIKAWSAMGTNTVTNKDKEGWCAMRHWQHKPGSLKK